MNRAGQSARDVFMNLFGGVFENSPWIAEQVFESGDGSRLDLEELDRALEDYHQPESER